MADRKRRDSMRTLGATFAFALACLAAAADRTGLPARAEARNAALARAPAVAPGPVLSIDDADTTEGDVGVRNLAFTVHLSEPVADTVTVDVNAFDGTATAADADYVPVSQSLSFPPGSIAESLTVKVLGDTRLEGNEVFAVRLSHLVGAALADSEAVGTLTNDDLPLLSIDDADTTEGNVGVRNLAFTVRLSEAVADTVTVEVTTFDSTATVADADYVPLNRSLVFPPGSSTASLTVKLLGDTKIELDDWFHVRLSGPVGAVFADSEAVGTITSDDLPVLTVADTSLAEGDAGSHPMTFNVRLAPAAAGPVTFHYEVRDGTALAADGDYQPTSGDTLFDVGQNQIVIPVPIYGDSLLEGNERFTLRVSSVQGAAPAERLAIGTLTNDEHTSFERLSTAVPALQPGTLPPAWGDYDGDGRPDLPLYLNNGTTFIEMPGMRTLLGNGNFHGAAWCDYDRDGDLDFVLMPYRSNETSYDYTRLFENTPNGLQDVGASVGIDIIGYGETPAWGDFNADGWPDLFLPFYSHVSPFRSYFYLNLGNGQFLEAADSAGVSLPNVPVTLRPEGVAVADWNGDGALDLYCGSHLFLNDGDARFTDVRAQVGLPVIFDEGAQFVDYDDDGDLDLYLRTSLGPTLFRNESDFFTNVTASLGVGFVDWEWGDRWADVDCDGDLDLLYFPPNAVARLLLNQGDGTFREDSSFTGTFSGSSLSSFADIDGDGDLDIAVGANGRQIARNRVEGVARAHMPWMKVRVEDDGGRLTQHGATVRLRSLDDPRHPVQTRIVDGGSGYLGQDEYTITFGGVGSGTYDLEVSFPAKPGIPGVVGPLQNPLLGGIRPGDAEPKLVIVRPSGQVTIQSLAAPVADVPVFPGQVAALWSAAPNPTRGATRFGFSFPADGMVTLTIHDLSGRKVRTLLAGGRNAGRSDAAWDLRDDAGRQVPAGLYFAQLSRNDHPSSVKRVVVLR